MVKRLKEKAYATALQALHVETIHLQDWVKQTGAKVCIVFEGRDGAGKGGVIKTLTERVSPRVFRVLALPAPTERERSQMYIQRYVQHLPAAGEVVIFDRSWYNRAGVERVMNFCSEAETERFLEGVPTFEREVVSAGTYLLKYWLEVSPTEQTRRLTNRIEDERKTWKLSAMDLASYKKWDEYTQARDRMFAASDTPWAPWFVARSDDKRQVRLDIISHILGRIPYEPTKHEDVALSKRDDQALGQGDTSLFKWVPQTNNGQNRD